MLCLSLFLVLLTTPIWTYVTETPSFIDRLGKLYEKLEKITIAPTPDNFGSNSKDKLYAKLERFNALSPDKFELSDEEEELISTMEKWGLSADQMDIIVKELQRTREDDEEKIERNEEYNDEDEVRWKLEYFTLKLCDIVQREKYQKSALIRPTGQEK